MATINADPPPADTTPPDDTPTDVTPAPKNPYNFGSYTYGKDGTRIYDNYTGDGSGNTLIDLQKFFSPTQTRLSNAAKAALDDLSGDPSNLSFVAKYQAANSALMNLFGAQTQVLKQIFDKIEAMNRNL